MSAGTLISIILAMVGCILAVFFYMNDSINQRIEKTVNHPDFIKKLANELKLPLLIFNEDGTFQSETGGATEFIDKIEPFIEDNRHSGFIVYPKKILGNAPILYAINRNILFTKPKRINTIDWQYRIPKFQGNSWANSGKYDEPPEKLFRLEIIR